MEYLTPLETDDLRALGIGPPWTYGIADRVRFGELDALNHVNHTAYLRWFESFRLPYLADREVTRYGPGDARLVLRQAACDYLAEMKLGEDYVVTGRIDGLRTSSFTMAYACHRLRDGTVTATGSAVVVLLDPGGGGKVPIPDRARAAIRSKDGVG